MHNDFERFKRRVMMMIYAIIHLRPFTIRHWAVFFVSISKRIFVLESLFVICDLCVYGISCYEENVRRRCMLSTIHYLRHKLVFTRGVQAFWWIRLQRVTGTSTRNLPSESKTACASNVFCDVKTYGVPLVLKTVHSVGRTALFGAVSS